MQSQSDDLEIVTLTAKGRQKAAGRTQRPRNDPPSPAELDHARKKLMTVKSIQAAGANIRAPTLYALCKEFHIAVDCPRPGKLPKKSVLLNALEAWVSVFRSFLYCMSNLIVCSKMKTEIAA